MIINLATNCINCDRKKIDQRSKPLPICHECQHCLPFCFNDYNLIGSGIESDDFDHILVRTEGETKIYLINHLKKCTHNWDTLESMFRYMGYGQIKIFTLATDNESDLSNRMCNVESNILALTDKISKLQETMDDILALFRATK